LPRKPSSASGAKPATKAKSAARASAKRAGGDAGHARAEAALSKAVVTLMRNEPFYAHIVGGLPRISTEQIPAMAVGLRGENVQLLVHPTFLLEELATEERVGVLKHEILHVVLRHLFRRDRREDPLLWNIAADLVVNQLVAPCKLPDTAVTLDKFQALELKANQTVEHYYDALRAAQRSPKTGPGLERLIAGWGGAGGGSDHSLWANGREGELEGEPVGGSFANGLRHPLEQAIEDRVVQAAERTVRARGTVPAWVERYAASCLERRKPKVDWRRALRIFATSSRRTRIVMRRRRESRRFESVPGVKQYEGLKVKRYQRMAFVIDTSGSIGASELDVFFAEVRGIYRAGCEVVVIECDADIGKVWDFDGRTPERVTGGGGTSFDPPMKWLREQRTGRFDACVYLTDAGAPAPTVRPPCPVLWVVCGGGSYAHLPGRAVALGSP
jgi:predicted metal-dependent peptidase